MIKKIAVVFTLLFIAAYAVTAQQPVVAVAPFEAAPGMSTADADVITNVFFVRLGNTRQVRLVDRSVVERVLREHNFQAGDWSDAQKTAELGSALNANWIVRGNFQSLGNSILVIVSFFDIQTFEYKGGADIRLANLNEVYDRIDPLVASLVETIADSGVTRPDATPASQGSPAEDSGTHGDFEWRINGNRIAITGYRRVGGTVTIPAEINSRPVTSIEENAFSNRSLTSVIIPNGVTHIMDSAFSSNNLTTVNIPNSVMFIGQYAFHRNRLTSVNIPIGVTFIGNGAFSYNLLTSAHISDSVTTIGETAFSNNQLTSIFIPGSVSDILSGTFSNNQLTSVTISNGVRFIGRAAFDSNSLTSVTIPGSVSSIDNVAFGRNPLISITIGANVFLGENVATGLFNNAYHNANRQAAGTYTRPNANSTNWTRR